MIDAGVPVELPIAGDWCWGVDPGANLVGLAWSNGRDRDTKVLQLAGPGCPVAQRMHELFVAVRAEARALVESCPPVLVVVEAAIEWGHAGMRSQPIVHQANGVVQAAMFDVVRDLRVPVLEMEPATWKKGSVGRGNAKKGDVLVWARALLGLGEGESVTQDEADALGCAEAARRALQ